MAMNTLTLSLSTETRRKLQDEATAAETSIERHINQILARRFERPSWPDRAEAAALAAEVERLEDECERARTSAVLHEGEAHRLMQSHVNALGALDVAERAFAVLRAAVGGDAA